MFWIISGRPGASKTSRTLDFVLHDKRFKTEAGEPRPVFYRGIRELKLPWHELDDEAVKRWPDELPDGAVLVVDEAQQIWPVRPASKPVPVGLTALETHRHHGWDVIFISQDPSLLDSHARKICNEHFHFSRPFGAPFVIRYHSGSGFVNPASKSELAACVQTKMGLPKRVFGLYKSAEVHTHKFRPPKFVFLIPVLLALVVGALYYFKHHFLGAHSSGQAAVSVSGGSPASSMSVGNAPVPVDWSKAFQSAVPGIPYTKPLYRESIKVTAVPVVRGCMSFRAGYSDCSCYTQQGTRITDMPHSVCVAALKYGVFNPFQQGDPEPISGWRLAQRQQSQDSGQSRSNTKF